MVKSMATLITLLGVLAIVLIIVGVILYATSRTIQGRNCIGAGIIAGIIWLVLTLVVH